MNHHLLNFHQFQEAIATANLHLAMIRKKHPTLRAYLVLSLRGDQTKPDNDLTDAIREFPSFALDNAARSRTLELIKDLKRKELTKLERIQMNDELKELEKDLEFDGSVQVELRFHHLDYELIWRLQTDALVDRVLTPQTQASINIILGPISRWTQGCRVGDVKIRF